MLGNFLAMPPLLKVLTAGTLVVSAFFVVSMIPHNPINVIGGVIRANEWWASGAGAISALTVILFAVSASLMLKRSSYGRLSYVIGWIALCVSTPIIARLTQTNAIDEATGVFPIVIFNFLVTALISSYLYRSKAVKRYFFGQSAS